MSFEKLSWMGVAVAMTLALVNTATAQGQAPPPMMQANPTPGCTATPAQMDANKKVVISFFQLSGADRVALADPSYIQHNPAFKKRAQDDKISDYEEFKKSFMNGGAFGGGGGRGPGAGGPPPPRGNPLEVVTAECDIVTVIHKNYRQDPTADPGTFYEAYAFDTFRVKDGKLTEHWDGAMINPPGAPGGR
jgi:predicted SnoaL-like aldol condensation-catalyzing enzyme